MSEKSHFREIDAVWLATLNTPSLLFSSSLLMASFQTTYLGIAWYSVLPLMLCWLLLNVSWILLFLLVPALKTRLSSFIGGPASGLCLLQFIVPTDVWVPCWITSVTWWFISWIRQPITISFCYVVPSVPGSFSLHLFVHSVNCGWHNLLFLLYLEAFWLILPDLDLVSALQWALSWPSGRVSCFTFSVPIM